jgi:N-acetylneuraminic acid mutarotase
MTRKRLPFIITLSSLILMGVFLFFWWVYAICFFPLKNNIHNGDFDSVLSADLPKAVTEAGGVCMNDSFFLLGGLGPFAQSYSSFFCFSFKTQSWKKIKDFPCPISHPGIVAGNGKIYVAGGFNPLGIRIRGFMFANWKPRSSFMIYDPSTDKWTRGVDMPAPRGAGGVCYFDSSVYYAGGIEQNKQICNTLLKYDLRTNRWDSLPPMPTPRDHLRMEAVDGMLYAISGRKDDLRFNLTCVEAFDIKNNSWSNKANIPVGRGGLGSVVFNGKIYTFGGENVWSCFNNFEEYDPETDQWRILNNLPEPRHGICAGVINNEIHMVSGGLKPRISISSVHRIIKINTILNKPLR